MNESDLDRRLRRWMADRDPGPLPSSLRISAGRVAYETPVPIARRVRNVFVGPVGAGRVGGGASRTALAVLLAGALVAAMIATLLVAGATRRSPAPGLERWGAFVVDRPAPTMVLTAISGAAVVDDDKGVEFEDFLGSTVAVLVPADGDREPGDGTLAAFLDARRLAGEGVVFVIGARSRVVMDGLAGMGGAGGIDAVDLAAGGVSTADFPDGDDALVVVDRHGIVAAAFAGTLPDRDQLVELLRRLEVGR